MFQSASIPNSQLCISAKIFLASLRVKSSSSFFCLGYTPRLSCCFEMQCHLCTEKKNCLLHLHFWNAFFFFSLKCWQLQSQLAAWFRTSHVFADLAPLFAFLAVRVMSRRSVLHSQSCSWRQLSVAALAPLALGFAGGLAVDEPDFYGALPRLPAQDGPSSASPSSVELRGLERKKNKTKKKTDYSGKAEVNRTRALSEAAFLFIFLPFPSDPFIVKFIWLGAETTFNFISCARCSGWQVAIRSLSGSFNCLSARAWHGTYKVCPRSCVRHCPTPYKASQLFHTTLKYSSWAVICASGN